MSLRKPNWPVLAAIAALLAGVDHGAAETIEQKAAVCTACHGGNGVPISKTIPVLFGQNEGYIYIELRDMKKGARKNEEMKPIVENMSRDDMLALAAYFAAKPWPNLQQPRASAEEVKHSQSMAAAGTCPACHQAGYIGAGTQPRLAGQSVEYLSKTMLDFRSGARANNAWMRDLMKTFSEDDIRQMARVLAGL
jgi:cytochrome c553